MGAVHSAGFGHYVVPSTVPKNWALCSAPWVLRSARQGSHLEREYPGLYDAVSVGRAGLSKRQDWSLEAAEALCQLVLPLLMHLVKILRLDANVLRDSTLQRLELLHMGAYLHASATTWIVCFEELRRLTNSKKVELMPPRT
jgi:hypothetical protein